MQVKKMECYIQENYDKSKSYKNKVNLAKKVVKYLKQNNINENDLITYTTEQFEELIKFIKPTSLIDVSDVIYRLNDILKYCFANKYSEENLLNIRKEPLWLSIKNENKMKIGLFIAALFVKYSSLLLGKDYFHPCRSPQSPESFPHTVFELPLHQGRHNRSLPIP